MKERSGRGRRSDCKCRFHPLLLISTPSSESNVAYKKSNPPVLSLRLHRCLYPLSAGVLPQKVSSSDPLHQYPWVRSSKRESVVMHKTAGIVHKRWSQCRRPAAADTAQQRSKEMGKNRSGGKGKLWTCVCGKWIMGAGTEGDPEEKHIWLGRRKKEKNRTENAPTNFRRKKNVMICLKQICSTNWRLWKKRTERRKQVYKMRWAEKEKMKPLNWVFWG